MLSALGLDEVQESAYRTLVRLGAAEVPELALRLARPEEDTERALHRLERQGLAARSSGRARRWVAVPPGTALGTLLSQRRHELARAEQAAAALADAYRDGSAGATVHEVVEGACGTTAVGHRSRQLLAAADGEVCALVPGAERLPPGGPAPRGVRHRIVIERALLARPAALGELYAALGTGCEAQIRVVDQVPTTLLVADGRLALVTLERPPHRPGPDGPADDDQAAAPARRLTAGRPGARRRGPGRAAGEPDALIVHPSGLLTALLALFESVWRDAVPLRLDAAEAAHPTPAPVADGPDAVDLDILSLLLSGLTDASVAKQLELGLRTVQRRVKGLMELAGVSTRLQLGWHAYERRWVSPPARPADARTDTAAPAEPGTPPRTAPPARRPGAPTPPARAAAYGTAKAAGPTPRPAQRTADGGGKRRVKEARGPKGTADKVVDDGAHGMGREGTAPPRVGATALRHGHGHGHGHGPGQPTGHGHGSGQSTGHGDGTGQSSDGTGRGVRGYGSYGGY